MNALNDEALRIGTATGARKVSGQKAPCHRATRSGGGNRVCGQQRTAAQDRQEPRWHQTRYGIQIPGTNLLPWGRLQQVCEPSDCQWSVSEGEANAIRVARCGTSVARLIQQQGRADQIGGRAECTKPPLAWLASPHNYRAARRVANSSPQNLISNRGECADARQL